jgi:hypothetical protein
LACWLFIVHGFQTVNLPDLCALKTGDASAWDEAFNWLWPTVFAVAKLKLQPYFPNEIEDVAIESHRASRGEGARGEVGGGIETVSSKYRAPSSGEFAARAVCQKARRR